ncbi:hypothetical protein ACFQPA_07250 [Halomarina halobia]|uniref:Uncharacterized protein n=1 Tax=Halomarina halobia TaxID=3033386 RepID=A0ABD6ACY0_9EURY|nr:hypothetical protein [Halomarina sp. PSR21]
MVTTTVDAGCEALAETVARIVAANTDIPDPPSVPAFRVRTILYSRGSHSPSAVNAAIERAIGRDLVNMDDSGKLVARE